MRCLCPLLIVLAMFTCCISGIVSAQSCTNLAGDCLEGCYNNTNICTPCPPRTYTDKMNLLVCGTCGVNQCGSIDDTTCNTGIGSEICIPCPAGSGGNGVTGICVPCLSGYYSNPTLGINAGVCLQCPPGSSVSSNGSTCIACPVGTTTFYVHNDNVCNTCQVSGITNVGTVETTPGGSSPCSSCIIGSGATIMPSYFNISTNSIVEGTVNCQVCPVGMYSLGVTCYECPLGSLISSDQSTCIPCPINTYFVNGTCTSCPLNEVSSGGNSPCYVNVPLSTTVVSQGYFAAITPAYFNVYGNFIVEGNTFTVTTLCTPGTIISAPDETNICVTCLPGSTISGTTCIQCTPGSYCPGNNVTIPCPFGSEVSSDMTTCVACPVNSTAEVNDPGVCVTCEVFSANSISSGGNGDCGTTCNPGFTPVIVPASFDIASNSVIKGSVTCATCPGGTYSPVINSACLPCGAGMYSPSNATSCSLCPSGTFNDGTFLTCQSCPCGTATGHKGAAQCSTCGLSGYSSNGTVCDSTCPSNSTLNVVLCTCQPCPIPGQVFNGDNCACPFGQSVNNNSCTCTNPTQSLINSTCTCLPNQILDFNHNCISNTTPVPCNITPPPHGGFGNCPPSLPSGQSCSIACNSGYKLVGASTSCVNGQLTSQGCSAINNTCSLTAPVNGGLGTCSLSLLTNTECSINCNVGYTVVGGSTVCSPSGVIVSSQTCAPNCIITSPVNGNSGTCAPSISPNTTCILGCNSGFVLTGTPVTTCPQVGIQTCIPVSASPCPFGSYMNVNTSVCTPFPINTFPNVSGVNGYTSCPIGFKSPGGGDMCSQCPGGTYPVITPATYNITANSITPGSLRCTPCPSDYISSVGSETCTQCPEGTYTDDHKTCFVSGAKFSVVYIDGEAFIHCSHHSHLVDRNSELGCECDRNYHLVRNICVLGHNHHTPPHDSYDQPV
jgi:hypothetical protein